MVVISDGEAIESPVGGKQIGGKIEIVCKLNLRMTEHTYRMLLDRRGEQPERPETGCNFCEADFSL